MDTKEFKPNKKAFVAARMLYPVLVGIILLIIANILFVVRLLSGYGYFGALLVVILGISFFYIQSLVMHRKRKYVLKEDRIIQYAGGIVSDDQTELLIKNITHIKRIYPFIEYKLFLTGHIDIQSAGSRESEVTFDSMNDTERLLSELEVLMTSNGFNLGKEDLKYTENPHPLGVFFEIFKNIFSGLVVVALVTQDLVVQLAGSTKFKQLFFANFNIFVLIAVLSLAPVIMKLVFKFLDLFKREYRIYENIITYTEGFLTKHYAFIPFKNLSDSATTQTLVDKIFGLYDVKLSAQGSGHEIAFKNLKRGREISETLDGLLESKKEEDPLSPTAPEEREKRESGAELESEFTAELYMHLGRYLFTVIFWALLFIVAAFFLFWRTGDPMAFSIPVFGISIFVLLIYIQARFTKFSVKRRAVERNFDFLVSKQIEFNNEKITGVLIKRNFADKWFHTMTVQFWSIGSPAPLQFSYISYNKELVDRMLAKNDLTPKKKITEIRSQYTLAEFIKAWLFWFSGLVAASLLWLGGSYLLLPIWGWGEWWSLVPVVIVLMVGMVIHRYRIFYYKHSRLRIYEDVVHFRKGVLFQKSYFVRYDNVKDVTTIHYPFSSKGILRFNVAGERVQKGQKGQQSVRPYNFVMNYVPDIGVKDDLIDHILLYRSSSKDIKEFVDGGHRVSQHELWSGRPSLKNPILITIVILILPNIGSIYSILRLRGKEDGLLVVLGSILLINSAILAIIAVITLVKCYIIENNRVLKRSGIFYREQTSVVFEKIDFLNNSRNLINKIFGNGNVTVHTVGSSRPELDLKNITDHMNFYERLQRVYKWY